MDATMAPDEAAWAWGLGGGYVWRPDRLLRMSVGASFEHAPLRFTDSSYSGEEFPAGRSFGSSPFCA